MKNSLLTLKYIKLLFFSIICIQVNAQKRVGDPGITFDDSKYDQQYPQMLEWQKAGVRGGIPYLDDIRIFKTLSSGSNSSQINQAINDAAKENELVGVLLENGTYTINSAVKMKSNVALIGESRNGVQCIIDMDSGNGFRFDDVSNSGIYRLTIEGSWGTPKYKWNYSLSQNDELPNNDNISVKIVRSEDCWLDKVNIYNSARDPIRVPSNHVTLRDLDVKGAHKKAGGAQGYFFIQGAYNLITGCSVTHLRHISLQGGNVEYNVVYDNQFKQEVSFHSGDAGNNLIENNIITLPSDMSPVSQDELLPDDPIEIATNKPVYFAIMGPWSTQHDNSEKPNFIINNTCLQLNHNHGSSTPWSEPGVLYKGPLKLGLTIQERIQNFPEVSSALNPTGETLYPIDNAITLSTNDYLFNDLALSIYPNPADSEFYLNFDESVSKELKIEIRNIEGKLLRKLNTPEKAHISNINTSNLTPGIYLVTIIDQSNTKTATRKLVIDR
ncbi:T9SS type A sorting domain-containing protein [Aquimarina litoralis]|uniref:T9SS type A sorting domain-containing protein n=1 Tax=Aquimarina litoralis TaxID=584605 RepID=UPI001C57417E|nr:T9SS type A sorting domain-containing protein [Aquimarina litoralis]MBW1293934.1 T9SS type A sorting domain-containing protein [Aquimarina litoralis]